MIIVNKQDEEFIKENIPNPECILEAKSLREAELRFLDWLDRSDDCWDATGRNYSALGTAAQRVYDNLRISNSSVNMA